MPVPGLSDAIPHFIFFTLRAGLPPQFVSETCTLLAVTSHEGPYLCVEREVCSPAEGGGQLCSLLLGQELGGPTLSLIERGSFFFTKETHLKWFTKKTNQFDSSKTFVFFINGKRPLNLFDCYWVNRLCYLPI